MVLLDSIAHTLPKMTLVLSFLYPHLEYLDVVVLLLDYGVEVLVLQLLLVEVEGPPLVILHNFYSLHIYISFLLQFSQILIQFFLQSLLPESCGNLLNHKRVLRHALVLE